MARYEIIWAESAWVQLETIGAYVALDSPFYAEIVTDKLLQSAESLSQFPERGHQVLGIEDSEFREIFVYQYRIVYLIEQQSVRIVSVIHGKRDFDSLKKNLIQEEPAEYGTN